MPEQLKSPAQRDLQRIAEDVRLGLEAIDAAGAGIAAAMRSNTMDPDGAYHLLRLVAEPLKAKMDALVAALVDC